MAPPPSPLTKLLAPLKITLGDPRISGPALLAVLLYPQSLQSLLPVRLSWFSTAVTRTLGFFFTLSVVKLISAKLSQWGLNNYRPDAVFVKSDELVLLTGGTSGIGELTAREFAERGVKVIVLDLHPPKEVLPTGVTFYECDVTSTSQIAEVGEKIRKDHGDPTVLINNAGVAFCRTILGQSEIAIRKTFEVNTISHYWMVREFLPAMIKKNHGHIVTVSSMASFVVHAQNVDYSCSKASTLAFHEGLASELVYRYNAPDVKTTVVHPTWVRTPLIESAMENAAFRALVFDAQPVAVAIAEQVISGRSAQIFIPSERSFLSTFRGWPSWMQQRIRNKIAPELAFWAGRDA